MLHKREIENVLVLSPFEKYKYFLKRVADEEEMWSLENEEGELAIAELNDKLVISFWSSKEFAEMCVEGNWKNFKPTKIDLSYFEVELIPIIIDNGYLLNIFPRYNKSGFVVSIDEFLRDLNEELEKYS